MKRYLIGLGVVCVAAGIGLLGFTLYENNAELRQYKREIFGVRADYRNLQNQFDDYKAQIKSLRQLVILAKTSNSKHVQIANKIYDYSKKVNGDLSIYYKNLTTEETIFIDPDKTYYMASLYKVILTLFLLDEVSNGNTSLETRVGTSSATLNNALDKIITESNNEYAQTLAVEYGWKNIETKMKKKLGIEFSFSVDLDTSVKTIGLLFEDIALSLKVSSAESSYLLNLLKDQKKTGKLPKYLPNSIYSHNKTGEFDGFSHDAGIFYTPKANYILVFMRKTKLPGETNEQMALMSKDIYETLNTNSK